MRAAITPTMLRSVVALAIVAVCASFDAPVVGLDELRWYLSNYD